MRLEITHGSGAKTFVNSHQQLIHISLDGQYHLLGNGLSLSLKQLEEIGNVINRCGGRWNDPAVAAKVQSISSADSLGSPGVDSESGDRAASSDSKREADSGSSEIDSGKPTRDLKQQLA